MLETKKRAFSFGALIKKIRNIFIQQRNQPLNWFHILRWRLRWLNPFSPLNKGRRWWCFKYFFRVYLTKPENKKLKEGVDYDRFI